MANLNLMVIEGGVRKQKASNTQTVDFSSIRIGASNLQILEATGNFDFSAKKLTNIAAGTEAGDAVRYDQLPVVGTDFADNAFRISNNTTPSKKIAFDASGISASTVRTVTMPDADINLSTNTSGSFANRTLSNLGTTAINASLLSAADNTIDVGSGANRFANVWGDFVSSTTSIGLRDASANPIMTMSYTTNLNGLGFNGPFIGSSSITGDGTNSFGLHGRNRAGGTDHLLLWSGNSSSGGTTGNVSIRTGSTSGTVGKIALQLGNATNTVGDVWTADDVNGSGHWAAIPTPVDTTKLPLAGGTMSGAIAMGTFKITGLGDPTANQDAATKKYVDDQGALKLALAGGTMSGNIAMGANKITGLANGTANNDAANFGQLAAFVAGAVWLNPIMDVNLIDATITSGAFSGANSDTYIAAATAGGWTSGHAYQWNGVSAWVDILGRAVAIGDRFIVSGESATIASDTNPGGTALTGQDDKIAQITDATPGAITFSFETPTANKAVYCNNPLSYHSGHQYNFNGTSWVEFGGLDAVAAGIGLSLSGNSLNVNMGAGIVQLPSDEIGIDFKSNGGLWLVDPTTGLASTATDAQLSAKLDSTSLSKSSSGLAVNLDEDTLTLDTTVKAKFTRSFTNDNAGTISAGQVAYIKSNGNVDLAIASTAGLDLSWIGVVKAATIATTASGLVTVRPGAIVSGLSGLTPGAKQYLSRATAGAIVSDLTGFVTGENVYSVGYAISATEMVYQPQFEFVF